MKNNSLPRPEIKRRVWVGNAPLAAPRSTCPPGNRSRFEVTRLPRRGTLLPGLFPSSERVRLLLGCYWAAIGGVVSARGGVAGMGGERDGERHWREECQGGRGRGAEARLLASLVNIVENEEAVRRSRSTRLIVLARGVAGMSRKLVGGHRLRGASP
jgi:hypothetical protein